MILAAFSQYLFGITIFVSSIFLIMLVLVQRGRGGGLTGALGGAGGQSAFGTKAGDLFTKITIGVAAAWIILCAASVYFLKARGLPTMTGSGNPNSGSISGTGAGEDDDSGAGDLPQSTLGTDPLGTNPLGTNPLGTNPLGTSPLGTSPLGTDSTGSGVPQLDLGGSDATTEGGSGENAAEVSEIPEETGGAGEGDGTTSDDAPGSDGESTGEGDATDGSAGDDQPAGNNE